MHINEYLYSEVENDTRTSGEKIFDYVDPKNRNRQIEMEEACTEHLKEIGGYLEPEFKQIEFSAGNFEYEASVIIPVRNRIRTIRDAIRSVLSQKTDFKFNLIIIDNHSTDGTTEAIDEFKNDERLIHIIPERNDLGIGGCWNMGVHHPKCGKFAIQLDSDDVYANENTLAIMVRAFYEQNCAMVVGTYMMTDFNMNMIAPGIIDHKEWTPHNGRNNALRINGLGAPRNNKRNRALTAEAEFYRAMAMKKAGSKITIPKRQFIGNHPDLEKLLKEIFYNTAKNFDAL